MSMMTDGWWIIHGLALLIWTCVIYALGYAHGSKGMLR